MPEARKIPPEQLQRYFDDYSRRFLVDGSPEAVDLEVVSPEMGDQPALHGVRLLGIVYDPHDDALEFALDGGEHRAYRPAEVWVMEDPAGFISQLEIAGKDGSREVISIRQVGLGKPL